MDVHDKITNDLEIVCDALGWESVYVNEYTEAAAIKAAPLFQSLGYDYGDRIPSVYKLQDTITELVNSVGKSIIRNVPKGNYRDLSSSTGMFVVKAWFDHFDDDTGELGQWQFEIYFNLLEFAEHRVKA
jgi:hypothetical protein